MVKRVLVIDNNPVILKLLDHILKQRKLQVRTAVNGLSALEILEDFQPDIIFTDLIMPYIGGEKLCRIIRKRGAFAQTLLVVVSAIVLEENVDFQAFGAHACIAKGPVAEMSANIDLVLTLANSGRIDLLAGMKLGSEHLVHRAVTKELLDTQHHLQLIVENTDNGIIEFSEQEKIVACNKVVLTICGKDEVSVLGTTIRELFSTDTSGHFIECLEQYQKARMPVECRRSIQAGNRTFVFRIFPLSGSGGNSSIIVLLDITEEKRIHKTLKEYLEEMEEQVADRTRSYQLINRHLQNQIGERQKMHEEIEFVARQWSNTFDTIADFVSVHDNEMKFVRVNRALADFLGRKPQELVGQHCFKVLHGLDHPWPGCPHLRAIKTGKTTTFEVNDDHIGIPLLATCTPMHNEDGTLLGTVHVARDISEQKNGAIERENLIQRLEESLAKVKQLRGFIPICASCKKIRDDQGYWQQVEEYIRLHSEAQFSHSICPVCAAELYPDLAEKK